MALITLTDEQSEDLLIAMEKYCEFLLEDIEYLLNRKMHAFIVHKVVMERDGLINLINALRSKTSLKNNEN